MRIAFQITLIILSVFMIGVVLLQGRGSGLGMAFGGDSNVYRTKRGMERVLFFATIALAVVLFGTALIGAVLS